ncbi:MAG: osmotically inducible protein OsmC [Chloroflexi bacterium 44-23]|nr:MAG: osmotically inducible protein OsmC [Chloroflexi bacterium 44-23]
MDAKVTWSHGLSFLGTADSGFEVPLGVIKDQGGDDDGFRPMELLLIGLAGCTAMDAISIMQKKKQEVSSFEVRVHADRAEQHPKVFTHIVIEYLFTGHNLDRTAAERSVQLSAERYCPAQAMLKQAVPIEMVITLIDA